jgi:hypothetical protein
MGTNYYRVPSAEEMNKRHESLKERVNNLNWVNDPALIESGFRTIKGETEWDRISPWEEFTQATSVHLGKRSGGWKFCWNFHKDKYYSNKEELFAFICDGRVVDEYGTEFTPDEFIEMAINWCPDGWDTQTYYKERPGDRISWIDYSKHQDRYVDGLRISSSTEFS